MSTTPDTEKKKADALDVAQAIIERLGEVSAMKLQKLVYYAQAWHTVWADNVLFDNRIEAWKDGPVVPDLWRSHANKFRVSEIKGANSSILTPRELKTIDNVIDFYGDKSAQWLSDLTHMEAPWLTARQGVPTGSASNEEITPKALQEYYASL